MKVIIFEEAGINSAVYGFSLSYKPAGVPREEWWTDERINQAHKTALANAHRDGGHNKFLESMMVWISVDATLEWWKQFDTYRVGVSKQSSSTMHTLDKVSISNLHLDIKPEEFESMNDYRIYIEYLLMVSKQPSRLKSKALPQAYLQERQIVLSYKVIRHIIKQRYKHKLSDWQDFINQLVYQLRYEWYLGKDVMELMEKNVND